MKRQKYDLVFSIGAACSCTQGLRGAELQFASFPFDWLFGSDFTGRIDMLCNKFKRFIDFDDLEFTFSERSIKCDAYHNKFNDLTFNHDFQTNIPLSETYNAVREKYNRRITRLLDLIEKSERVLAVYMETPSSTEKISPEDLIVASEKLRASFPDTVIDILYVSFDTKMPVFTWHSVPVNKNIMLIYGNYKSLDKSQPDYVVSLSVVQKMFRKNILIKLPLQARLSRMFLHTLLKITPVKSWRQKIKHQYRMK